MDFCECGRVWPCKDKTHEKFNIITYAKKYFKVKKKFSGFSKQREDDGQFQALEGR